MIDETVAEFGDMPGPPAVAQARRRRSHNCSKTHPYIFVRWEENLSVDEARTRPLKIVHVITRLINGGADENTVLSCNQAAEAGHEVYLIHGAQTNAEIIAKLNTSVRRMSLSNIVWPLAPISDARALGELTRLFRSMRPDIVHTHTSKAGFLGRLAARAAGVPTIIHGVHIAPFDKVGRLERYTYLIAEKAVESVTHAFIDVSRGMRDVYIGAGLGDARRHFVIPSGFDLDRFRNARPPDDWRELLRLGPAESPPPVILIMAALEPRKRHLEFLDAFPEMLYHFPNLRLLLAGEGKLRPQIEAKIQEMGVGRHVVLTGFRADPERLIALADVCLLMSMREGLPRVVVQYLAGGKPCIVTDLPGIREVLRHGENGVVTQPNDMRDFVAAVISLLKEDQRRARLTCGAAATDLSDWDGALMGKRIEAVYRQAAQGRIGLGGRKLSKLSPT